MVAAESSVSDEQLVAATLAGDDHAFAELTRRHKSRVFGVASRFARDASELEDICQDVFVQVYFKLRQFRRDSPFEHWVLRITTYKCYDYLRKRRRDKSGVSVDALLESGYEPSAPEEPPAHPDLERLHAALAQLSPKERLVITLLELEERSVLEIADLTGWSVANVKVRAFRARGALRKLLEKRKNEENKR
jgi:RNA polymerase sigma-70 factor, ECF subfamily